MKKNTISLFLFCFFIHYANAQWNYVGSSTGISAGEVFTPSIALSPDGTPYIAYVDDANSDAATVLKYDGSNWVSVGTVGVQLARYTAITIDANGNPFLAYQDYNHNDKVTVMEYTGGSWTTIGSGAFSDSAAQSISIVVDHTGVPYVAYTYEYTGTLIVEKYNGSSWVKVGNAPVTTDDIYSTDPVALAVDNSGTPYVTYMDTYASVGVVRKFNGTTWEKVFSSGTIDGVTADPILYPSMVIDNSGSIYVAFQDPEAGGHSGATVMKYVNQVWDTLGQPQFTTTQANYTSIAVNQNGTPYLVFQANNLGAAVVDTFDGSNWHQLGTDNLSLGQADNTSIVIDPSGVPYVIFKDYFHDKKVSVMKWGDATTGIQELQTADVEIYPNPSNGNFTITVKDAQYGIAQMNLSDVTGRSIKQEKYSTSSASVKEIHLEGIAKGIYTLCVTTGKQRINKLIEVQ